MTGFGPAIVFISFGTLLFSPKEIIATSAVLDLLAGLLLAPSIGSREQPRFLLGLILAMSFGTVLGALALGIVSAEQYLLLLALAIFSLAIWFTFFRARNQSTVLRSSLPERAAADDLAFSAFAGLCGGLFGISGPPIIWHLGRQYQKEAFRGILVTIFVAVAFVRTTSYGVTGMMNQQVLTFVLVSIPGLLLGLMLGKKAFLGVSERRFSCVVGLVLFAVAIKLLGKALG